MTDQGLLPPATNGQIPGTPPTPPAAPRRRSGAWLVIIAALGVLALTVAGLVLFSGNDSDDAEPAADDAAPAASDEAAAAAADGFTEIEDATGQLTVEVPDTWADVDGRPLADRENGGQMPNVQAAPSLADFRTSVASSGVSYSLINGTREVDATLDFLVRLVGYDTICTDGRRTDYADGEFAGRLQRLDNCGNVGTTAVFVVATPTDGSSYTIEISYQLAADAAPETGDRILSTFRVNG
jgi:hypothetical protein